MASSELVSGLHALLAGSLAAGRFGLGAALLGLPGVLVLSVLRRSLRDPVLALILALGAGLSSVILIGLLLHLAGAVSYSGWTVALTLAILALVLLSQLKKWRTPSWQRAEAPRRAVKADRAATAGIAAALLLSAAAVMLARHGVWEAQRASGTELWAVRNGDRISVAVRNQEGRTMSYQLAWRATDGTQNTVAIEALAAGQTREVNIAANATPTADASALRAELYRAGDLRPYRHVSILR